MTALTPAVRVRSYAHAVFSVWRSDDSPAPEADAEAFALEAWESIADLFKPNDPDLPAMRAEFLAEFHRLAAAGR